MAGDAQLEATDFRLSLCLVQVAYDLVGGGAAELLTEVSAGGLPHAQHRLCLLVRLVGEQRGNHVDGTGATLQGFLIATVRGHAGEYIFGAGSRRVARVIPGMTRSRKKR